MASTVIVRDATEKDCDFIAKMVYLSAESHLRDGLMSTLLPSLSEEEHFEICRCCVEDTEFRAPSGLPCALQWKGYIICEVDGQPAGALKPYSDAEEAFEDGFGPLTKKILSKLHGEEKGALLGKCFQQGEQEIFGVLGMLAKPTEPSFHVETVGTDRKFRRKGVNKALMKRAFEIGREKGFKTASIMILSGNDPARIAYERAGFVQVMTISTPSGRARLCSNGITLLVASLEE